MEGEVSIQSKPGFSHSGLSLLIGLFLLFQNLNYVKNSKYSLLRLIGSLFDRVNRLIGTLLAGPE